MFKFTIRELLLLTVIVALALGWGFRERHWLADRWESRAKSLQFVLEQNGWQVEWRGVGVYVKQPDEAVGTTHVFLDRRS